MTPDADSHWSHRLPARLRPYASLARWDRPVGYWLLALPGWTGIAFAGLRRDLDWSHAGLAILVLVGAVAMRGAGCTYNDIVDRDLDAQVERTRARPLPSGAVSVNGAWGWLVLQCLVGLVVLLLLPNRASQLVALASLPLVAAYPFMKRIWGFPQVWLGLTFNWAVLVAYTAVAGGLGLPVVTLYLGLAAWTLGYDTIYALQDLEDDQLAGIKSSAISFGKGVRWGVAVAYLVSIALVTWAVAGESLRGPVRDAPADSYFIVVHIPLLLLPIAPFAAHLSWQAAQVRRDEPVLALRLFKSNVWAGLALVVGVLLWGVYISLTT